MKWNEKLKQVRTGLGLSLDDVREKCNIPVHIIQSIESGGNENPGILTILKLTDAYDIDLGEVMY